MNLNASRFRNRSPLGLVPGKAGELVDSDERSLKEKS
jgi:hypothetical protein